MDWEAHVSVNENNKVSIEQESDYPVSDNITIRINPEKSENFTIAFRIPAWSKNNIISINGIEAPGIIQADIKKSPGYGTNPIK